MSAPQPIYNHVPSLWEALPATGGQPGVKYLHCNVTNLVRARNEDWGRTYGADGQVTSTYEIVGPKGTVACELLSKGNPIPGQSPHSGKRECEVDMSIYHLSGLKDGGTTASSEPKEPTKRATGASSERVGATSAAA